jgi:hypothetical protein
MLQPFAARQLRGILRAAIERLFSAAHLISRKKNNRQAEIRKVIVMSTTRCDIRCFEVCYGRSHLEEILDLMAHTPYVNQVR